MIQSLFKGLFFKGIGALLVKVVGILFAILTSVILARNLSLNEYGLYSLSINILNILVVFSVYGIDQFIIKEYSLINQNLNDQISNFSYQSAKRSLLFILVLYIGSIFANKFFQANFYFLLLVVIAAPIKSTAIILSSYINSKGKPLLSVLIKESSFYMIFAIFLLAFKKLSNNSSINITTTSILYLSLMITSLMTSIKLANFRFTLKKVSVRKLKLLPYFINNLSNTIKISIPILLLGILLTSEEVALFSIPAQIMIGFTMLFSIMGTTFSPKISSMLRDKNYLEVRKLNSSVIRVVGSIALIGFFVVAFSGKQILYIWGEEYQTHSYPILLILASGQLVNIFTGFNGFILLYSGYLHLLNIITIASLILTPLIIMFSIHFFGLIGAALGVSISITAENLVKYIFVKKKVWKNVDQD